MSRVRGACVGLVVCLGLCVWVGSGCKDQAFTEDLELGGQTISAEVLNTGHEQFRRNCIACHGKEGRGDGASSSTMDPRPRDFTQGVFKFKSTPGRDALPTDADLRRTVRKGLKGTYMNGFDRMSEADLEAVTHYIKTFSSRWRDFAPPAAISIPEDLWSGRRTAAVERGEWVYHVAAQCWSCHPSYWGQDALESAIAEASATGVLTTLKSSEEGGQKVPWRADLSRSKHVDSAYGKLLPPNFSGDTLRAARKPADLYRTIGAGIGGTEMPAWSETLSPDDIWALTHYIRERQRLAERQ